jgi:hypothetical protein
MAEHTPTPWIFDSEGILSTDRDSDVSVIARVPNHPDNAKAWESNAAFIVNAANNHEALVKALETILAAEQKFRTAMGDDWEGDPLSDAIDAARALVSPAERECK